MVAIWPQPGLVEDVFRIPHRLSLGPAPARAWAEGQVVRNPAAEPDEDILQHRHAGQQLEVLECPADADPDDIVRRALQHGGAFELDRAFGGIAEPRDAIE